MTGVLVVGEALIDIVQRPDGTTVEHSGGSAANVAVALARLGRPVQLLTAYGDDERGAVLARHLNQSAVGLIGDPHSLERTATAAATLGPDGGAAYTFDIDWRLNALPDPSPVVVHTCSIGAVLEPGASDVRRLVEALRPRATVSYDVNARPAVTGSGPDVVRAVEEMAALAGQRPTVTRAQKSIAAFKVREGMPIGCRVTLRNQRMWEFLDRLISVALPRVRDFRGVPTKSFDGRGNYTLGVRDHLIFPEVDFNKVERPKGMNITIVTTAGNDERALYLLRELGVPFQR